jgi:eukaryotic-like serine/threonine-protein kinase
MSSAPGGLLADRYELRQILGRGGMGEVWRAWDRELERDVAIKSLLPHLTAEPDLVGRFRREARALARLRHPGIIALYDILRLPEERIYLVLEFVPGEPLDAIMARGPLGWKRCADIGSQVCDALAVAHAEGVVHRDVKPGNILVEPSGAVRVADFGLARLASTGPDSKSQVTTKTGIVMGTPGYWAPEQALGKKIVPQTDLYALGAVLFEAATGRLPFVSDEPGPAAAFIHIASPVPDPRTVRADLPADAAGVIMRALAKEPEGRYESAADMAIALRQTAGSLPPAVTYPPTERGAVTFPPPVAATEVVPVAGPTVQRTAEAFPAPAPPSPPARPVVSPEATTGNLREPRRASGRVVAGVGVALVGVVVAAGVGGTVLGRGDAGEATPAPESRPVSSERLAIRVDPSWTGAPPALDAVGIRSPIGASGSSGAGAAAGLVSSMEPNLLAAGLESTGPPTRVRLGSGVEALRHRITVAGATGGPAIAFTVPTSAGVATVVCILGSGDGASERLCDDVGASLTVSKNTRAFAVGPSAAFAKALTTELATISRVRAARLREVAGAEDANGQATAALGVAVAYAGAADRVPINDLAPGARKAAGIVVRDLRALAGAYRRLAAAARGDSTQGWATGRRTIAKADDRLSTAVKALEPFGYRSG